MLNIITPYGNHYKIDADGNIIRTDIAGFKPSGQWKFLGLQHVKKSLFMPFKNITKETLNRITSNTNRDLTLLYKNGNPQWTVRDLDHGTVRTWGNTRYHGIKSIWID